MTEEFIKDYFLENHITLEDLLKTHRLTFLQAEQLQKEFAAKFRAIAVRYNLRTDGLLQFCRAFLEKINTECSDDLRFLYLAALTDCGLLFHVHVEERTREQNVRCYLEQSERMEEFSAWLQAQKPLISEFSLLKSNSCHSGAAVSERAVQEGYELLHKIAAQRNFLKKDCESSVFCENLMELVRRVQSSDYRRISPYLYTAVLSTRRNYMLGRRGYSPNLKAMLERKKYRIEEDNGKNYAMFTQMLRLYLRLRSTMGEAADAALSDYCFAACSNLSEWYYFHADMEDASVPMSISCKLREIIPASFPYLPDAPQEEDMLEAEMLRAGERIFGMD